MKRSRFSEEQIIAVFKEQEAGMPMAEVCRRHGISSATFYKSKSKYGGLEVSDARRLHQLVDNDRIYRAPLDILHWSSQSRTLEPAARVTPNVILFWKFDPAYTADSSPRHD